MVSRIEPSVRATALSARDMFDSAGQIVGGPVVGAIGTLASLRIALLAGRGGAWSRPPRASRRRAAGSGRSSPRPQPAAGDAEQTLSSSLAAQADAYPSVTPVFPAGHATRDY